MEYQKEIRRVLIFFMSFIGLFLLSKFALINPGIEILDRELQKNELVLKYGDVGFTQSSDTNSLYWGSVSNENFQDIYHRLNYLINKKVRIKSVKIDLHQGLFAQKKFDGDHLARIIPYYPVDDLLERVLKTGLSYELVINFFKYKLGVPFRSTREINLLLNNFFSKDFNYPYFSRKVKQTLSNDNLGTTHFLWLSLEMLSREGIKIDLIADHSEIQNFPGELKINELLEKIRKIYKNEVYITIK